MTRHGVTIMAAAAAAALMCGAAAAQTPTESARWLVPHMADPSLPGLQVGVYNVGQGSAKVRVAAVSGGRVLATPAPQDRVVPAGGAFAPSFVGQFDYVLIISDAPVMATGAVGRRLTDLPNSSWAGTPGHIKGTVQGVGGMTGTRTGDMEAQMLPVLYHTYMPVQAMPVTCQGATAQHFACSTSLQPSGGRPSDGNLVVRGDAQRLTQEPAPGQTPTGRPRRDH